MRNHHRLETGPVSTGPRNGQSRCGKAIHTFTVAVIQQCKRVCRILSKKKRKHILYAKDQKTHAQHDFILRSFEIVKLSKTKTKKHPALCPVVSGCIRSVTVSMSKTITSKSQ